MPELTMPALGADMRSGTLLEWTVAPGDHVTRGDIVASVDTDKAEIEIETFHTGVIEHLLVEPGTKVAVGAPLATITSDGEAPAPATPRPAAPAPSAEAVPTTPPVAPDVAAPESPPPPPSGPAAAQPPPAPTVHHRRVSPLARRVAVDLGVDVEQLEGTGPGGAVTRVDVERAAQPQVPAAPEPAATAPAAPVHRAAADRTESLNRAVGELMARSKREIPHYHLSRDIDLTAALEWLGAYNAAHAAPERLLPAALLLRAAALAAHDVPEVNGTYEDDAFLPAGHVDLGVAISMRAGGVIAPVIPGADSLALVELMAALRALTARARRGVLQRADLAGATLTVTSLGEHGADLVHGVIFPPQVALVGFGRIAARPWAVGDLVGSRQIVTATLAGDHRVSDGHRGSLYLASLDHHLQEPDTL